MSALSTKLSANRHRSLTNFYDTHYNYLILMDLGAFVKSYRSLGKRSSFDRICVSLTALTLAGLLSGSVTNAFAQNDAATIAPAQALGVSDRVSSETTADTLVARPLVVPSLVVPADGIPTAIAQDNEPATAVTAPLPEVREVQESIATPEGATAVTPGNLWDRIRAGFALTDLTTPLVADRTQFYAARPAEVRLIAERSRRYLFHIVEELEKRGMPTELALLPMVESAFNPLAYSRAQAAGLWQFIPSTGKNYNLSQNWWYDGRRDIVASTTAALDYLQAIYQMHGDWHLALASYNWGEYAVARAVDRNQRLGLPTDYSSLQMPDETRYYVPKLQALKNIVMNPAAYGIDLPQIANAPYFATVTLTRDIDLRVAARLAEMPIEELVALNPGHNRPVVSSAQAPSLVLPADHLERFLVNVGSYDKPLSSWRTVNVKVGEHLSSIAATHGISVESLRQVNGIRGSGRLREDASLLVPAHGLTAETVPGLFAVAPTISAEPERVVLVHPIGRGENWVSIARRYGVSAAALRDWNRGRNIVVGQRLTVYVTAGTVAMAAPAAIPPRFVPLSTPLRMANFTPQQSQNRARTVVPAAKPVKAVARPPAKVAGGKPKAPARRI